MMKCWKVRVTVINRDGNNDAYTQEVFREEDISGAVRDMVGAAIANDHSVTAVMAYPEF